MISGSNNGWQPQQIGELRSRISILAAASSQDAYGQPVPSGSTLVYSCWARIAEVSAREVATAQLVSSQVSHTVTLRWPGPTPLISPGMKVQYAGPAITQTYIIQAVQDPEQRHVVLKLLCLAINASE